MGRQRLPTPSMGLPGDLMSRSASPQLTARLQTEQTRCLASRTTSVARNLTALPAGVNLSSLEELPRLPATRAKLENCMTHGIIECIIGVNQLRNMTFSAQGACYLSIITRLDYTYFAILFSYLSRLCRLLMGANGNQAAEDAWQKKNR